MLLFQKYPAPFCLQKEMKLCTWVEKVPNQWILFGSKNEVQNTKLLLQNESCRCFSKYRNCSHVQSCFNINFAMKTKFLYQLCWMCLEAKMWKLICTESLALAMKTGFLYQVCWPRPARLRWGESSRGQAKFAQDFCNLCSQGRV